MSKKLRDEPAGNTRADLAQGDPRIISVIEGIRFHSKKDREKCQRQIDEMLSVQLKSMASAMYEDHRRQRNELQNEIFRLHDRIRNLSIRHAQDLIDLSKPQTSANEMLAIAGQIERATDTAKRSSL